MGSEMRFAEKGVPWFELLHARIAFIAAEEELHAFMFTSNETMRARWFLYRGNTIGGADAAALVTIDLRWFEDDRFDLIDEAVREATALVLPAKVDLVELWCAHHRSEAWARKRR